MMNQAGDRKTWLLVDSHGYQEQSLEFFEELIHVTEAEEVVQVLLHSVRRSPALLASAYQLFAPLLSVESSTSSHTSYILPCDDSEPLEEHTDDDAEDEAEATPTDPSEHEPSEDTRDTSPTAPDNDTDDDASSPLRALTPPPPVTVHPLDDPTRPGSADRTRAMLQDPYLAGGLRVFLREHRHEEQYLFWRATETYRTNWTQYRTLHTCVLRIWERFLRSGTPQQVMVPTVELQRIEAALEQAKAQPDTERQCLPVGLFDVAQREVIRTLEEEWIPQFKQDTAYIEAYVDLDSSSFSLSLVSCHGVGMSYIYI